MLNSKIYVLSLLGGDNGAKDLGLRSSSISSETTEPALKILKIRLINKEIGKIRKYNLMSQEMHFIKKTKYDF